MFENLTSLCVTSNQVDEEVGEDGEEDKDEELSHGDDSKPDCASRFAGRCFCSDGPAGRLTVGLIKQSPLKRTGLLKSSSC